MLKKNISERAWISTDYAFQSGIQTWREAIRIHATELRILDTFHAEFYEVSRIRPGYGFAAYGEKAVLSRFVAGVGICGYGSGNVELGPIWSRKALFLTA